MARRFTLAVLAATGGVWLIAACSTPAPVEQTAATPPASAAPPAVMSPVSINASMVSIVDHAGHQLWRVEQAGNAPKTKADWENLAEHATQLAAAGALVRVAGPGPNDVDWVASPDWQKWARAMSDAAMAALKATEGENFDALVAANGQLVVSCEGCHKAFKPDLPSEGIVHAHAHAEN
jgi:cytochrome c556